MLDPKQLVGFPTVFTLDGIPVEPVEMVFYRGTLTTLETLFEM